MLKRDRIIELAPTCTVKQIAERLGANPEYVRQVLRQKGLRALPVRARPYRPEDGPSFSELMFGRPWSALNPTEQRQCHRAWKRKVLKQH